MTADTPSTPKPRRRWQFSLRTMMLLMVPVACVAAWLGAEYRKGLRQKEAIAWVEESGGWLLYDDEVEEKDWRRELFGEWFPERVKTVDFTGIYVSLESGMPPFVNDQLTEIGPLAELENIQHLNLAFTQVSDLTPLAGLKYLIQLDLSETPVRSLAPLAEIENLEVLHLGETQVVDISPLTRMKSLRWLTLSGTQVCDLPPMAGLENLRRLNLTDTQVCDPAPLAKLENLHHLYLSGTEVNLEQVQALQQALPDCEIYYSESPAR